MATVHVATCVNAGSVEGLYFPEFDFETLTGEPLQNPLCIGGVGLRFDLDELQSIMQSGDYDGVRVDGYGMRVEFFIAQRAFWQQLVSRPFPDVPPVSDDEVVINIRCGDKNCPDCPVFPIGSLGSGYEYSPLPIDFYRTVVDDLGLTPVFVGQIDDDRHPYREYIESLRESFPDSRFISGGATQDFEMMRRAKNKVVAVSTFSWVAAWLGPDDSRIVMPVAGFLNPTAWPEYNFIPRGDPRYSFRWVHVIPYGPEMSLAELLEELSCHSHDYPLVYRS